MLSFLQNFNPSPIMLSWGPLKIYWYGFFIVLGLLIAFTVVKYLAKKYQINKNDLINLIFYLFVFGVIGARIYDILLEWRYFIERPLDIFKIWEGGMAIHGAILAGIIVVYIFIKKKKIGGLENYNFWEAFFKLSSIIVTGLALGQFFGRWGNYFNQELFGRPTSLPWGIYIDPANRPLNYLSESFFHPTFLYESIGNLIIFAILIFFHLVIIKKNKINFKNSFLIVFLYFILYSILRFSLEFVRIDFAPLFLGLRFPQVFSLLLIIVAITLLFTLKKKFKNNNN